MKECRNDGGTQMVVVLTIKEIRYTAVGVFDDMVSFLTYLHL